MRVAIFSDIHGNLEALEAILKEIKNQDFDEVICLGDVIGIGPNPKECLEKIKENHIRLLLGNHERYFLYGADSLSNEEERKYYEWLNTQLTLEDKQYLEKCSLTYSIGTIAFAHYLLEDATKVNPFIDVSNEKGLLSRSKKINSNLVFVGHYHRPFLTDKVVCIGSSGCVKSNKTSYYKINIEDTIYYEQVMVEYDRAKFEQTMRNIKYPNREFVSKIFFGIVD